MDEVRYDVRAGVEAGDDHCVGLTASERSEPHLGGRVAVDLTAAVNLDPLEIGSPRRDADRAGKELQLPAARAPLQQQPLLACRLPERFRERIIANRSPRDLE